MTSRLYIVFLFCFFIYGCSDFSTPQEDDIKLFKHEISWGALPLNDNIDISSIYKPGDLLFDAVLAIQRNHWSKAIKELTPYAEKKDPDALFWLAQISYGSNPTENIKQER